MTPSVIQVSRQLRLGLEEQFAASFNGNLDLACGEFYISNLAFRIAWNEPEGDDSDGQLQNFYRGDRTFQELLEFEEPDFPALAMWTGEFQDEQNEHYRVFSGKVSAYWRFFLFVKGVRQDGLVALREAVESAMLATLDPELTGMTYYGLRGDLQPTQKFLDQDSCHVGWLQEVNYSTTFEVRA